MPRPFVAAIAAVVLLFSYGVADVFDVAPGILTRDKPTALPAPSRSGPTPSLIPLPTAGEPGRVLDPLADDAPAPTEAGLTRALADALGDPALGTSVGISVRDGVSGKELLAKGTDRPRVPASTAKILTAAAVSSTLDMRASMTTRVVRSAPNELVLVAGGDTLLGRGRSDPDAVMGRAGIATLASRVARTLRGEESTAESGRPVTVRLDTTYAAGDRYAPGWNQADVQAGYTQGVAMLGFADERPDPGHPSPSDPEAQVLVELADALSGLGVDVRADSGESRRIPAPEGADVLGEVTSAAYVDVLALALDDSDNALTENLARQAAVASGRQATFEASVDLVEATLRDLGLDLDGTRLLDTSGLTHGQSLTVRLLSDVLAKALDGTVPALADLVARLPVAGLDGTLFDRFVSEPASEAAGIARAKTGTLTGSSGMVGTTVDADDRQLAYVVIADQVPAATGTLGARAALDRLVAAITRCGCGT